MSECKGWNVGENVGQRKKGKRVFKYAGISFVDAQRGSTNRTVGPQEMTSMRKACTGRQ